MLADRTSARSAMLGLTAISLGFVMITLDATIVNVALGPIGDDLGNNSIDDRLVDETLDAYVEWREECAWLRDAYRRWSTASLSQGADAFREYLAALNREEHAANHYAWLIRAVSQPRSFRSQNRHDEEDWKSARSWWRRRGGTTRDLS